MIALIEHDMDEFMLLISQVVPSENRSIDSLIDSFVSKLEVQAGAIRNERVKQMAVKAADYFRETTRKVIEPMLERPTKEELDMRV